MKNTTQQKTFLIAAGGTGGHIIPGIAIAKELLMRGHRCTFVGTHRGLEHRLVPEAGFKIEFVNVGPWNGASPARRLKTVLQLASGLPAAASILEKTAPAAILSLGGYTAAAIVMTALGADVPIVVMEPNVRPGLVNRLTGPFATWALVGFKETMRWFPEARCELSGIPIRSEFFDIPPRTVRSPFTVLVTGGSLGAKRLNEAIVRAVEIWRSAGRWEQMNLIHQTGELEYEKIRAAFAGLESSVKLMAFIDDMPRAFTAADIVICRAGASTLAEIGAAAKPSLLVPYSFATDQHQLANAKVMTDSGAARLIVDQELDGERLAREVTLLMDDPKTLRSMESAARRLARPGAIEKVADRLESVANLRS